MTKPARKPEHGRQHFAAQLRWLAVLVGLFTALNGPLARAQTELQRQISSVTIEGYEFAVQAPAGWVIEPLVVGLAAVRMLTFHPNGDLFVGSRAGVVYRLPPPYQDPGVLVRLDGYPHSVAFRGNDILVARTDGLYRARYEPAQQQIEPGAFELLAAVPGGQGHDSRTVAVGPDARVYLSLGIRANCSDEYLGDKYPVPGRRGGVMVLDESVHPPKWVAFATGLRNPVGFDWHPETGVAYASNNGPDHLGFEQPREIFARLDRGSFHGMPWFQWDGTAIVRDKCIDTAPPRPASEVSRPDVVFAARSAPMGVAFVPSGALGDGLAGDAVVALRGSWGTAPDGMPGGDPWTRREPKLVLVRFAHGRAVAVEDLVTGFQLSDGRRWLRPVGVAFGPDGALYFSADEGIPGIYRLQRRSQ